MRNLTIKRNKSGASCLVKMKVYIEDPSSNEIVICDTPCRKLGDLKNGEEKTFQIENDARKIYVIGDMMSRNYSNDLYQLPEGEENIFLSGECKLNYATGNAFRFDGNEENPEAVDNRKRTKKKGIIIFIAAIVAGLLIGLLPTLMTIGSGKPKTFSEDGMTITLTKAFDEYDVYGMTAAYESDDVIVFALEEEFTLLAGLEDYTLREYAELVMDVNSVNAELKTKESLTYFEYEWEDTETGDNFHYVSFVFKTDEAFWTVQFATFVEDYEAYADRIFEWASSIKFD